MRKPLGERRPAGGDRARLFVALELPVEVRQALGGWWADAWPGLDGLRPVADDHLHVTLCFLGRQPVSDIESVGAACAAVSGRYEPADAALGSAVWLPLRRPRVLAVRLQDREARLAGLQAELSARLHAGGWYEPERRPYLPHVTVARVGRGARLASSPPPAPPPLSFVADRLTLFRSHLSPRGARYEALVSVALRAA